MIYVNKMRHLVIKSNICSLARERPRGLKGHSKDAENSEFLR